MIYAGARGLPRAAHMRHGTARPDPRRLPPPTVGALSLLARLPARLADLPEGARRAVGTAIDRRAARIVRGWDGTPVVVRADR